MSLVIAPDTAAPMLLDAEALGRQLGLSTRTVRRMDTSGLLPRPVRIGRNVRWRWPEVIAWTKAGCPERDLWTWAEEIG